MLSLHAVSSGPCSKKLRIITKPTASKFKVGTVRRIMPNVWSNAGKIQFVVHTCLTFARLQIRLITFPNVLLSSATD